MTLGNPNHPQMTSLLDSNTLILQDSRCAVLKILGETDDLWKNVWNVVDPVGQRAVDQVVNGQRFPLGVDDKVLLDGSLLFFLRLLVELIEADRRDVCPGADAGDLRAQVVDLVARERRVADDLHTHTLLLPDSSGFMFNHHHHHHHHHHQHALH